MRYFCPFNYLMTATESHVALMILNTGKHQNFVYLFFLLGYLAFEMLFLAMNFQSIIALLTTALRKLHSVPLSKVCVEKSQVLLDNVVRLLPNLYDNKSVPSTATLCIIFLTRYLTMVPCLSHLRLFFKLFEASTSQEFILWCRGYPKTNGRKTRN